MVQRFLYPLGLMTATIVGAGMFSLPYVTQQGGWATASLYLILLTAAIIFSHDLYAKVLIQNKERKRLLGLVENCFGAWGRKIGLVIIVGGLLVALVIYLILGQRFLGLLFPAIESAGVYVFWLLASLPLLFGLKRLVLSELLGGIVMAAIIFFIFTSAIGGESIHEAPRTRPEHILLPFGAILFSLAGWTAIEPILEAKERTAKTSGLRTAMAWGVILSAALYALFVFGIFYSAPAITDDTLSGLAGWPPWRINLLFLLGLFAIWTSYVPISVEIKNALVYDIRTHRGLAVIVVVCAPLLLYLLGLQNFIAAIGLAGGVFLSLQYMLIVLVARRTLPLRPVARYVAHALVLIFFLAAVYEVYTFIVR